MSVVGKLSGRRAVTATVSVGQPGRLVLLVDEASKQSFLVDTGSVYSIVPFRSKQKPTGPAIMAADRTPIKCWGRQDRTLRTDGHHFKWSFLRADVAFPILGADFLRHFDLMVDLRREQLVAKGHYVLRLTAPPTGHCYAAIGVVAAPPPTTSSAAATSSPSMAPTPSGSGTGPREGEGAADAAGVGEVVDQFPAVVNSSKKLPAVKHTVQHHIETSGAPVWNRYRRLDPEKLKQAKQEFADMEAQGVIRRSNSSWSSPLHMVQKADGSWRPCGDYRRLNLVTKPDLYPPPHMEDLTARLTGMRIFSKLDLRKGYWQVPVAAADIQKTAVITPFGLWEFLRMPFGLRNAGQSFQRFMDVVLRGLQFVFVYLDDILVASRTQAEHRLHLQEVLQRLQEHGLVINKEKCTFNSEKVDYLGHQVSAEGIRPLPARVSAIAEFPPPSTRGELQSFLGMINFYRRFMKGAAATLKPLTDATRGKGSRNSRLQWNQHMASAFKEAKVSLARAAELAHPDPACKLALAVDASDHHIGGVLQQQTAEGEWQPLSFFSRKLNHAESRYSTYDRELLACVGGIRHFRFMLEGRKFQLLTDHKPLVGALHRTSDPWSARQQRHLSYVAEYTEDIRHVAGSENVVADTLSRPASSTSTTSTTSSSTTSLGPAYAAAVAATPTVGPLDWEELAVAQATCPEVKMLQQSRTLSLEKVTVKGAQVWCDVSTGQLRPIVTAQFRERVFEHVHCLAHAGTRATTRLINNRFVWPGMAADVRAWCRNCENCNRAKVHIQEKTPIEKIPIPAARFSHVHVDIVGPYSPSKEGYTHVLTMVDRTTRWPETALLKGISAEEVLDGFVSGWIARYGVPTKVTTDRGSQFTSELWRTWCTCHGIQHVQTTSFHPQSNGMVERWHRQLKDALRARNAAEKWAEHLPWVLLGLRAAPKEESGISAGEAALGHQLSVPGQLLPPVDRQGPQLERSSIPATKRSYADTVSQSSPLDSVEFVYVKNGGVGKPFGQQYQGPYQVLERSTKVFKLKIGSRVEVVSRDRLRPHKGAAPGEVAQPPRRGRPPGAAANSCGPLPTSRSEDQGE